LKSFIQILISIKSPEIPEPMQPTTDTTDAYVDSNTSNTQTLERQPPPPIFRFNLSEQMIDVLVRFSKVHQFDDRVAYDEAWEMWKSDPDNADLLQSETERLVSLGYNGNRESVEDKIFKSGRYYFRNKSFIKPPPKLRGAYVTMSKELIGAMDDHIRNHRRIHDNNKNTNNAVIAAMAPEELFNDFCKLCVEFLKKEIERLIYLKPFAENPDPALIIAKIKKTYKNRVFRIMN